jgi:glycerol-3-phosphate dehydrogenase (NAD(P)+)
MSEIAVLGAGAWGIALAIQAARAGNDVLLWARSGTDRIAETRESPRLPGFALPEQVRVTGDIGLPSGMAIAAVPTQALRVVLAAVANVRELVLCAKGIEAGTLRLPLEIAAEVQPKTIAAVLTGPNFAHEIASGQPAAAVVASLDQPLREAVMARLATPAFRLYGSDDPIGAQLGGAAKNVIAIAAGAVTGAGLGENARAALITRGLAELARLTVALGGRAETVTGLSGLGDLLLTCTGPASRNFSLGMALGRGDTLAEILASRQAVTEGVTTAPALVARAQGVDMPICQAVAALLEGRTTLREAIAALLARPRRNE